MANCEDLGKGAWQERSGDKGGTLNAFQETARTADYIELFDSGRQVGARLFSDHVEIKQKDDAGWKFLAKGNWLTPGKSP